MIIVWFIHHVIRSLLYLFVYYMLSDIVGSRQSSNFEFFISLFDVLVIAYICRIILQIGFSLASTACFKAEKIMHYIFMSLNF